MNVIVEDAESPLTPERIDAVESEFGIKFPASYRAWLLKHNGGTPKPNGFHYKHETGPYTDGEVAWFFAIHDGPYERFDYSFRGYKLRRRRIPENLVGIARDSFGNLICLSMKGDDEGKVYFWDHEAERAEPTYENCHLIADSFDEFILGLH